MQIAKNLAERIMILYTTNTPEQAMEKSIPLIREEMTFVYEQTHMVALKDFRDTTKLIISTLRKTFEKRINNS